MNNILYLYYISRIRAISLDLIKRRLDKVLYKRLDIFQEDVFSCLERARKLSRTDSQIFEDSIELQSYFIRKRDDVRNLANRRWEEVYIKLIDLISFSYAEIYWRRLH